MTSQVIKDLQKLHLRSQFLGLEDVTHLETDPAASLGLGDSKKTPASPRRSHLRCSSRKESESSTDDKVKIPAKKDYFYRSPCPERLTAKTSLEKRAASPGLGLTEKAAQFCKENKIDGFSCKVFVGNVSYRVKDPELREFFNLFGKVIRANVCKDKKTKRSRGFGFVIFSSREEAERAINAEDYQLTLDGRLMTVSWAERRRKDKAKESSGLPEGKCLQDLALSLLENEEESHAVMVQANKMSDAPHINKLNDDILLAIFKNLEIKERIKIERVCKKWRDLVQQTWKSITSLNFKGMFRAFEGAGGLTDRIFCSILKRGCQNLQSLDLSASPYLLTSHGIFTLSNVCTELRYLDLSDVAVTNNNLKDIGKKCQKLETLVLGRCRDFGEKGLWWFLKQAKFLQRLEVTDNVRINGKCFWMLHESCKELILKDCVKISDSGLENISRKAPYLEVLDITNCLLLSDVGLLQIFKSCKNLKKLKVTGAGPGVTAQGFRAIADAENLEYLDISQNKAVTDDVVYTITKACKKLEFLNIEACQNGITDEAIRSISDLQQLKDLNISYLAEITDRSIEHISASTSLRSIKCRACPKLTNEALVCLLLSSGESLHEVDFSGCFLIDEKFLDNVPLAKRDETLPVLRINLGGTSVAADSISVLKDLIGNCEICLEKTYTSRLRTDLDPICYASFVSSDEDEDNDDANEPFHPFSAKGYTVRSSDLQYQTSSRPVLNDDEVEDCLENDDPAMLNEFEEQFMFD